MTKKTKVALGVVAGIVVIGAATSGNKDSDKAAGAAKAKGSSPAAAAGPGAASAAVTAAATPAPPAAAAATSAPAAGSGVIAPIKLSGKGQTLSDKFTAAGGLAILHATCAHCSSFSVEILDSAGKTVDLPVTSFLAAYDGFEAEGLDAGTYQLKVSADSAWTATITQPRGTAAVKLPQSYQGKGDQVLGPLDADGPFKIAATSTGDSAFLIEALDEEGKVKDLPATEFGKYDGATMAQPFGSGQYYLQITGLGSWTVKVSAP